MSDPSPTPGTEDPAETHLALMDPTEDATECDCMAGEDHVGPWEGPDYDKPKAGDGDE